MSPKRAPKLKDSCDLCSNLKIKCEKQRPSCSRCEKLGYQCLYSPARRKGRPHQNSNADASSAESAGSVEPPATKQQRSLAVPQTISPRTEVRGIPAPTQGTHARTVSGQQYSTYRQPSISTTSTSSPSLSPMPTQSSATRLSPPSSKSNECSDCAFLAMKQLQALTLAPAAPSKQDTSTRSLNVRISTASTAIKRLSAILICPCSSNHDVALLNAALCAAILDCYWTILRSTQNSASVQDTFRPSRGPKDIDATTSLINDMLSQPDNMKLGGSQQVVVRRVLEELPKAANVVTQFMRRYSNAGDARKGKEDLAVLLPTLAAGQRSRLKDMVNKATDLLTVVG